MTKSELLKLAAITTVTLGLAAGCASDKPAPEPEVTTPVASTEPAEAPEPMMEEEKGPSPEAKNAIFTAKIKQATAKKMGAEWRDTANLLAQAEAAAAAGDNDKAIMLARQAAEQYDDAIAQKEDEMARYKASQEGAIKYAATESEYTVESGDSLWKISGKSSIYGNPYQWPLIYKANTDKIKDADLIYAGQVFDIPAATEAEIEAAITHAKTRGAWTVGTVEASDEAYLAQ